MDLLKGIEAAWLKSAADAIVAHAQSNPLERFYAGSLWLLYTDYTLFGTPCFALNTESHIIEFGPDYRWSPADWQFPCIDSTIEVMKPLYSHLSQLLAGRDTEFWNQVIDEHHACLARVCRRITNDVRTQTGVFSTVALPEHFVVGIFEFREDEPLFSTLIRNSIEPEVLRKLPHPVWQTE